MAKAVITARPGRESWAAEEALDTIYPADPEARLVKTGFPGVFILDTRLGAHEISARYSLFTHAFISFITPGLIEASGPPEPSCLGVLLEHVREYTASVDIRVKARGASKHYRLQSMVARVIRDAGLRPSRGSEWLLSVEGVGSLVLVAVGLRRSCGPSCTLVYVDERLVNIVVESGNLCNTSP